MRVLFFCSIVLMKISLFAQIPMDTVIIDNKNRYYFIWEEDTYILTEYSDNKYKVTLNNTKLEDISNFAFNDFFYDNLNQKLFFSYNEFTKSYINMLDFGEKRFEQFQILENAFIYTLLKDKAIYKALNSNDQEILIYDLLSKNTTKQINLNNIFSFTGFDLYNVLSFNKSKNILLNTGVYEDGGLFDAEYYIPSLVLVCNEDTT